jgi:hypothetical protein
MLVEKPDTDIFLMNESFKLYRPQKEREKIKLGKRLGDPSAGSIKDNRSRGRISGMKST